MCVERIIEVGSRARRTGCSLGGCLASDMCVDIIVQVGASAKIAGSVLGCG